MADPPPEAAAEAHEPTERDEEQILEGLYGEPDPDGVYRGDG
ncbi:hypothetical protein [Spirillospora sp. NPDC047279]